MSEHYAESEPALALRWRGDSGDALTGLAQQRLLAQDFGRAARFSRQALQRSPFNVVALSTLGIAVEKAGHLAEADALMRLSGQFGWRDGLTQLWLFGHRLVQRRYAEGFARGDALLRREGPFQASLFSAMARAAVGDANAIPPLALQLRQAPPWRSNFLKFLSRATPQDKALALEQSLLFTLAHGPTPPTDAELGAFLEALTNLQKYTEAESDLRALSHAPLRTGQFLTDGTFEDGLGLAPFGWSMEDSIGWTAQVAEAPGEGHGRALRVEYDGFSSPAVLRQLVVMPRGDYRLIGQLYQGTPGGAHFLSWTISCAGRTALLARTAVSDQIPVGRWIAFAANVHVPDQKCMAQWLELSAEPGDVHRDVVVWYDNLALVANYRGHLSGSQKQ
jgi:hypothetical protein